MQDPQKQLQLELFLTRPGLRARAVLREEGLDTPDGGSLHSAVCEDPLRNSNERPAAAASRDHQREAVLLPGEPV